MIFESLTLETEDSWLCKLSKAFPLKEIELIDFHPFHELRWRGILHLKGDCEEICEWLSKKDDVTNIMLLSEDRIVSALKKKTNVIDHSSDDCYIGFQSSCHELLHTLVVKHNVFLLLPIYLREGKIEIQAFSTEINLNGFYQDANLSPTHHISLKRKVNIKSLNNPNLTQKQNLIMQVALDMGYYEIPRKSNLQSLSEHFQCSRSTMSEHLRKIEMYVMNAN